MNIVTFPRDMKKSTLPAVVTTCISPLGWVERLTKGRQPITHYREQTQHFCQQCKAPASFHTTGCRWLGWFLHHYQSMAG